ncbi:MAG: sigma-54-dependent transcriptional regulator [Rubripirellula sp.]
MTQLASKSPSTPTDDQKDRPAMTLPKIDLDLLLVDDEPDFRDSALQYFTKQGYRVQAVEGGAQALQALKSKQFDVAVVDVHMPEMDGVTLLEKLRDVDTEIQVLMLTGGATVPTAVASMKAGAVDYITKPVKLSELERLIQKAARACRLERENEQLRHVLKRTAPKSELVGASTALAKVVRLIEKIAPSDRPVLIQGESGTGKELVARSIHANSPVHDKPLVVINCAALPEPLLESELFGHEKGAFTGAIASKPGLFEMADGGTLFIDEFGELAGGLQAKLLRVLEDGLIRRLGSVKERRIQVRLIAATNRNLKAEVDAGKFREDLYYRVNVLGIDLPPLRDREGDVRVLTKHFLGDKWELGKGAMEMLENYSWPGNVRQLFNVLERASVLAEESGILEVQDLPKELLESKANSVPQIGSDTDLESLNRAHVIRVLEQHNGNKAQAARALGINRRSLYRLLDKFGV